MTDYLFHFTPQSNRRKLGKPSFGEPEVRAQIARFGITREPSSMYQAHRPGNTGMK